MKFDIANVIDIVLAVLFLVAICRGWRIGLVVKAGHLAALVGASILAGAVTNLLKTTVSGYLLFGVVFVVALVVLYRMVGVLKLVDYIPVVGTLNKLGGAVIGFVVEFIFFFILGRILFGLIPMDSWAQIGLTGEMIEKSYLLQAFVP